MHACTRRGKADLASWLADAVCYDGWPGWTAEGGRIRDWVGAGWLAQLARLTSRLHLAGTWLDDPAWLAAGWLAGAGGADRAGLSAWLSACLAGGVCRRRVWAVTIDLSFSDVPFSPSSIPFLSLYKDESSFDIVFLFRSLSLVNLRLTLS